MPSARTTGSEAAAHWGAAHGLRVLVVGTGCSISTQSRSTSFVVEHAGHLLGIDCPHPAHHSIADAGRTAHIDVNADNIDTWFITHIHADHASGLESVSFKNWYHHNRPTNVAANGDVLQALHNIHTHSALGTQTTLENTADHLDVDHVYHGIETSDLHPTQIGPFSIETLKVRHPVACHAVRVSVDGVSFAYSADTTCDDDMLAWMAAADVGAYDTAGGPIHCSLQQLTEHIHPNDRQRSMLVHRCDFDDEMTRDSGDAGFILPSDGHLIHLSANTTTGDPVQTVLSAQN